MSKAGYFALVNQINNHVDNLISTCYKMTMRKQQAIEMFGTVRDIAYALRISRQAVHKWPDELSEQVTDRVIGAATRLGIREKKNGTDLHKRPSKNTPRPRS